MNIRYVQILGIFSFSLYILLSFIFYIERSSMLDAAFQFFSIVRYEKLAIQVDRYLAFCTQAFPLLGIKLGLSLEYIAKLYSISFPTVYFFCFSLIVFFFKDFKRALLFLLFHFYVITDSFFWPQCELVQAISWFILYTAFIDWRIDRTNNFVLFYLINIIAVTSLVFMHPLILLVFSFYFLVLLMEDKVHRKHYLAQLALVGFIVLSKNIFYTNYYDSIFTSKIVHFITNISQEIKGLKFSIIYERFILNFKLVVLIFLVSESILIYSRKYFQAALLAAYSIGLIILIFICYRMEMHPFYLEGQYNLIVIFCGCSLIFLESVKLPNNFIYLSLILITLAFVYRICEVSHKYKARVAYLTGLMHRYKGKKIIKSANQVDNQILKMTWGSSFESWLISTINYGKTSSIILSDNISKFYKDRNESNVLITEWETIHYNNLNPKYFIFKDSGAYCVK